VTTPLFHIGGVSNLVSQVIAGGRLVFLRGRFDPREVAELIERERVTSWGGVPTMARRVIDDPEFERYDLTSLRTFPLGGAPVPEVLLERLRERVPHLARGLASTWGLSESGGFLTFASATDLAERPGTAGRPYPVVEVRVLAPDQGGEGELLVRSPTVMLGYLGADDGTVDADGWLHTGDLGRFEDDYVYITGRAKDMVIRGGENVACPHVESVLLRHPDVAEAAVLGIPHDDLGEELVATIVLRAGASVTPGALRAHAAESLAYFEIPSRWLLRTEPLPVLPTGKVDKGALRVDHIPG
jgi:acyl-CoA synthetase (AMP-forming)/AMP-acid ligase II